MKWYRNKYGKIYSGIRVVLFLVRWSFILIITQLIFYNIMEIFFQKGFMSSFTGSLLKNKILSLFATIITLMWVFRNERLNKKKIGIDYSHTSGKKVLIGMLLGTISITLVLVILIMNSNITLQLQPIKNNLLIEMVLGVLVFIIVGLEEEFINRGYILHVLNDNKKNTLAIIISSFIFSFFHILNPNMGVISFINIILAGIFLAYATIKTKDVWIAVGFHITWNFFQGYIFNFPVSGINTVGLYEMNIIKYDIISGDEFGPESGLATSLVLVLSIIVIWYISEKNAFFMESNNQRGIKE